MTRRLTLTLLRVWPGLAFIATAALVGYVVGYRLGYVTCMSDVARGCNIWTLDQ